MEAVDLSEELREGTPLIDQRRSKIKRVMRLRVGARSLMIESSSSSKSVLTPPEQTPREEVSEALKPKIRGVLAEAIQATTRMPVLGEEGLTTLEGWKTSDLAPKFFPPS